MSNSADIERQQRGTKDWNEWAKSENARNVNFSRTTYNRAMNFDGFLFPHAVDFSDSAIQGKASFKNCRFVGPVNFSRLRSHNLDFTGSVFCDDAIFEGVHVGEALIFEEVTFQADASFVSCRSNEANFDACTFKSDVNFNHILSEQKQTFRKAIFENSVDFAAVNFTPEMSFESAIFKGGADFTSSRLNGCNFDGTSFEGRIELQSGSIPANQVLMTNIKLGRTAVLNFQGRTIAGEAAFDGSVFLGEFLFSDGNVDGFCSFESCEFSGEADFAGRHFKNGATFARSRFQNTCNAQFERVTFGNAASFADTVFGTPTSFRNAKSVSGLLDFDQTVFKDDVDFRFFKFESPASFVDAHFQRDSDFRSIETTYEFDLSGSNFGTVPNFLFARFSEPPSFEGVTVASPLKRRLQLGVSDPRTRLFRGFKISHAPDVSHKFRKLKSLAISGHDHRLEIDFFAGEIQAKRFWHDHPTSGAFWAGYLFQWTSDFGRSLLRPSVAWALVVTGFTFIYFSIHSLGSWAKCGSDWMTPIAKAFFVSATQSLPFLFWGRSQSLKPAIDCLYGQSTFPASVIGVVIVQNILGTIFVFLFLLALRNQFKIR